MFAIEPSTAKNNTIGWYIQTSSTNLKKKQKKHLVFILNHYDYNSNLRSLYFAFNC